MIAYIEGNIVHKEPTFVIIDVGGMGYQVKISLNTYTAIEQVPKGRLFTYLHIREDAHTLYGFFENEEKNLFLDLISVSGVGANTAMIILSSMNPSEIQQAIIAEDVRTIQSIKGIGNKTAQRIILELKDKIMKKETQEWTGIDVFSSTQREKKTNLFFLKTEAVSALVALGIAKNVAEKNVDTILKTKGEELKIEEIIKLALKI